MVHFPHEEPAREILAHHQFEEYDDVPLAIAKAQAHALLALTQQVSRIADLLEARNKEMGL